MRITIDIDEKQLQEVLRLTGETKKSPAVVKALNEFTTAKRRQEFVQMVMDEGLDYQASNEDLEKETEFRAYDLD